MRWLFRIVILLSLFFGGYFVTERLVVYPLDPRLAPPPAELPEVTEHRVLNANGRTMIVWTAPARRGRPTILYLHGNAGKMQDRASRFRRLMDRGYGIVAPGYRGGSGSAGWPTEAGISADMLGLYKAVTNGNLIETETIPVLYGESIGAAVAIRLNEEAKAAGLPPPNAIVLEAPFTSIKDVANALRPELVLATGLMLSRWQSLDRTDEITSPLLILHGEEDELIPIEQGRAIFDAANSSEKEFVAVADAGHINVWKAEAQRALYRFLARLQAS